MSTIRNESKNIEKSIDVIFAEDKLRSFLGLMGRKVDLERALAIMFPKQDQYGIHTYFMRDSMDVVFLDEKSDVVDLKKSVEPWNSLDPVECKYIIESGTDFIDSLEIEIGDFVTVWDEYYIREI